LKKEKIDKNKKKNSQKDFWFDFFIAPRVFFLLMFDFDFAFYFVVLVL